MIDRRRFLSSVAGGGLALAAAPFAVARAAALAAELTGALEKSGFVYVSPLRADGAESTCHGEVWFAWLDGSVVIITGKDRWKSRAVARGLDRARIWVGDHGRWKNRLVGTNDAFRQAPHFDARAEVLRDEALLERLLARFERKYPEEIGQWRDRMRSGHAGGSRVLVRYRPV